jgi:UDP-glucose 6-dehydrogenase
MDRNKEEENLSKETVIVAGRGEVGRPLLRILEKRYSCLGIDVDPVEAAPGPCSVLHVCYPFQISDFIATTVTYIDKYRPRLTVINSTVAVGTTREVQERVDSPVVYSPVRGKHARMEQDMLHYQKFVGGPDRESTQKVVDHFAAAGFKTGTFSSPEAGELSKLLETTWLGVLVAWAQEMERLGARCRVSYDEINTFTKEIDYLPKNIFPGHIGGHCVMPNIAILRDSFVSRFLDTVVESNEIKEKELLTGTASRNKHQVSS